MATPSQLYAEAVAHFSAGRNIEASNLCKQVIALQKHNADAHNLLGLTLRRDGKREEALASFRTALEHNPMLASVHLNCGLTLLELGRMGEAELAFRRAVALDPSSTPGHFHLGVTLHHLARYEDASACFRLVLNADPKHVNTHALMGLGFLLMGQIQNAKTSLETALSLNPQLTTVHDGLGIVAEDEDRFDDALKHFSRALELNPNFAPAQFNRAVALLRQGDLAKGLPAFESRWRLPRDARASNMRDFAYPLWTGEQLNGKTLFVWGEQGLGDEIRTAGVVDDMLRRGDKIVLECDERLRPLLERSFPTLRCVARQDPPALEIAQANPTYQCPSDTLLRHVRPCLGDFPQRSHYLTADAESMARHRTQLSAPGRKVIGLSWSSQNAQFTRGKTIGLATFLPILKRKGFTFVDLQYGDTQNERAEIEKRTGSAITHIPDLDLTKDIDGLAALTAACDLVITVSNSTAHLAGALGVPTWVLLPFGHFQPWYWFSKRDDSPWYPSARLYRSAQFADWSSVIERVGADLASWQA